MRTVEGEPYDRYSTVPFPDPDALGTGDSPPKTGVRLLSMMPAKAPVRAGVPGISTPEQPHGG